MMLRNLVDLLGGLAILSIVFGPLVYILGGFAERRKEREWEDRNGAPRGHLRRWEKVGTARRKLEHAQREYKRALDDAEADREMPSVGKSPPNSSQNHLSN
jgi:hypothetical protein